MRVDNRINGPAARVFHYGVVMFLLLVLLSLLLSFFDRTGSLLYRNDMLNCAYYITLYYTVIYYIRDA